MKNKVCIVKMLDQLRLVCERFHLVSRQLRSRHDGRVTLDVEDEYDVQDLLHAMQIVLRQEPDVQLALVGEGRCQGEFEALAQQLDIAEHVTFTGKVHDPMAEGVYAAADVVCQLSRWQEVFGYVIAEAMAFGKPIVGSDTGGVPELVENGVTGFLVPPGDYHAAAEKILNLLADCSSRQGMGAAGLNAAHQKFDLQINVAQLIHLYEIGAASAQA